eukprot:scaffold623146_cov75-Attheya_sp.AAC.1
MLGVRVQDKRGYGNFYSHSFLACLFEASTDSKKFLKDAEARDSHCFEDNLIANVVGVAVQEDRGYINSYSHHYIRRLFDTSADGRVVAKIPVQCSTGKRNGFLLDTKNVNEGNSEPGVEPKRGNQSPSTHAIQPKTINPSSSKPKRRYPVRENKEEGTTPRKKSKRIAGSS